MTKKEFFNAVIEANINDDVTEQARAMLDNLQKAYANRKPTKNQIANLALHEPIIDYLTEHGAASAAEVAAKIEVSTQKASGILRSLETEGKVTSKAVKVGGKRGTALVYEVAQG